MLEITPSHNHWYLMPNGVAVRCAWRYKNDSDEYNAFVAYNNSRLDNIYFLNKDICVELGEFEDFEAVKEKYPTVK